MNPRFFAYAQRSGGALSVRALKNRCRNSQRWIVLADTAATFRRLKLAAVGPTAARQVNAKLQEVEQTSASKTGRGGAPSHVNVAYRVASEYEGRNESRPCIASAPSSGVLVPAQYFDPRPFTARFPRSEAQK